MTKRYQRGKQDFLSSDIRLLFTSLLSLGHCIVCPLIYEFYVPQKSYIRGQTIQWPRDTKEVNRSHKLRTDNTMTRRYQRGKQKSYIRAQTIQWPRDTKVYCLFSDLWLLFTSLVSLGHCIVCPLVYLFGISWSLYCLCSDIRLLFTNW
jgi:hypothetical protein